jgi:hypothetical protein
LFIFIRLDNYTLIQEQVARSVNAAPQDYGISGFNRVMAAASVVGLSGVLTTLFGLSVNGHIINIGRRRQS